MRHRCERMKLLPAIAVMVCCTAVLAGAATIDTANYRQSFDAVSTGSLPAGWLAGSTNSMKPLNTWKVQVDAAAPSPTKVLVLANVINSASKLYNICYTPDVSMKDGTIEVKIRADSGTVDQGGGIIWRVRDFDNYYLVRYNPLERDIRCFYVKNAVRREPPLLIVSNLTIATRQWFTLKIRNIDSTIEVFIDGVKKGQYTDTTFAQAGGVGLWTKADAASAFDNFSVIGNAVASVRPQTKPLVVALDAVPVIRIASIQKSRPGGILIRHHAKVLLLDGRLKTAGTDH